MEENDWQSKKNKKIAINSYYEENGKKEKDIYSKPSIGLVKWYRRNRTEIRFFDS